MNSKRIICPNCSRSLKNINAWHYCKKVELDELFENKSDEILLVFDRLLEQISSWEDVEFSATKNCIVFVRNKTFLVAKPMLKFLEIKFYSSNPIEDEDLFKTTSWNSKFAGVIRISNEHELKSKFFHYFKESYLIS